MNDNNLQILIFISLEKITTKYAINKAKNNQITSAGSYQQGTMKLRKKALVSTGSSTRFAVVLRAHMKH